MNYYFKYILLSCLAIVISIIFFLIRNEYVIIYINKPVTISLPYKNIVTKKNVKVFYWLNDKWNSEEIEIIWSNKSEENAANLANAWLNILDEEKVTTKKISLQSAMLSQSGHELFVSFDRSFYNDNEPTWNKLMIVESFLKTLRENGIQIQLVRFLRHHQLVPDTHLDFSYSWPLEGFLEK